MRLPGRVFAGIAALAAVTHLTLGDLGPLLVAFHSTAGWWWVAGVAFSATSLLARDRVGLMVNLALTASALSWTMPGHWPASVTTTEPVLHVAAANLWTANPNAAELIDALTTGEPEVVGLIEVSPSMPLDGLSGGHYPQGEFIPRLDSFGIGALGVAPFESHDVGGVPWLGTRVALADVEVEVLIVHTLPPVFANYHRIWEEQLDWIADRARDGTPRIVIGDLNITRHNPRFERLREAGLRDAFADRGKASTRTWTPLRRGPNLLRLDHALVSEDLVVIDVSATPRHGSDHRGMVLQVALR